MRAPAEPLQLPLRSRARGPSQIPKCGNACYDFVKEGGGEWCEYIGCAPRSEGVLGRWRIRLWTAGPLEGSTPPSPFPQGASLSSAPAPPWCSRGLWLSRPLRKEIPRALPASRSLRPHLVEGREGLTSDSGSCRDPRLLPSVPRGVRNKGRPRGWQRNIVASSAGTNRCVSV